MNLYAIPFSAHNNHTPMKKKNKKFTFLTGDHHCYVLRSSIKKDKFYIGYSPNPAKRLRQHNGEIVGGAKRTKKHRPWELVGLVTNFKSETEARQFEWALQNPGTTPDLKLIRCLDLISCRSAFSARAHVLMHLRKTPRWKHIVLWENGKQITETLARRRRILPRIKEKIDRLMDELLLFVKREMSFAQYT
jgi:predicted GIY-YIG superfamily endonuclease